MLNRLDNRNLLRLLLMALLTVWVLQALSGCGWRLRGSLGVALELPPLMLSVSDASAALSADLKRGLENSGVELVTKRSDAELILTVGKENSERRVLSVDGAGKVSEYELQYSIEYKVTDRFGNVVRAPTVLRQQRDYTFNESEVLAKGEEQAQLLDEMRMSVVQSLLLGLRGLKVVEVESPDAPAEAAPPEAEGAN